MRKTFCVFCLIMCLGWLAYADKTLQRNAPPRPTPQFRIDGIKAFQINPCKVRFQVQYYIDPSVSQACFIGAYIPNRAAMADFALNPAGRAPNGVPKGQKYFADNITFEMSYVGIDPYTSSTIEVVIYDSTATRRSQVINWGRLWKRFEVQGIHRIYTSSNHVKFQVQYFIDPAYSQACYIGAHVPNRAAASSSFGYRPAGRIPDGVPKGQKYFSDNVVVELIYSGSRPYTSTTLEVSIYNGTRNLAGSIINWGQTWDASVY